MGKGLKFSKYKSIKIVLYLTSPKPHASSSSRNVARNVRLCLQTDRVVQQLEARPEFLHEVGNII